MRKPYFNPKVKKKDSAIENEKRRLHNEKLIQEVRRRRDRRS